MTTKLASRRAVLLQAWRGAQKRIDRDGVAQLTADEEAGRLLDAYSGATLAYGMCELAPARELLEDVALEERGAIAPGRNAS